MIEVSFPGLGIDNFQLNPVAFEVFGLEIRWYGLFIVTGMIAAFFYAYYRSAQEGFTLDDLLDVGIYTILFGVLGARLYYVLMKLDTYILPSRSAWENFKDMIAFGNVTPEDMAVMEKPDGINLAKLAASYADGIILGSDGIVPEITDFCKDTGVPVLPFNAEALKDGSYIDDYNSFYDNL
jgi:hypothetical protein